MFDHDDLPTTPGAIIGYRKDGRPIRLIAGAEDGDGTGGDGSGNGDGTPAGDGGQPAGDGGTPDPGGQGDGGDPGGEPAGSAGDGDGAANTIAALRQDFKDERSKRQAAQRELSKVQKALDQLTQTSAANETTRKQQMDAIAVALGLKQDDAKDPEKLAAALAAAQKEATDTATQAQARERQLTVELALIKQAAKHGANPDLLADSRSFMRTLDQLDPASESFAEDLGDAIKTAVENNPAFKAAAATPPPPSGDGNGSSGSSGGGGQGKPPAGPKTTAPPRSGGDGGHNGAAGGKRQWTDADVAKATPQEVNQAMRDGLLVDLGFNPPKQSRR